MKMDLGSVGAHRRCSEVVMVASFVLCVRVCMHAREAEGARSHVGLVCTGCLVAFLVVCWSYCNCVVVVCLFADKLGPLSYNTVRLYSLFNYELINNVDQMAGMKAVLHVFWVYVRRVSAVTRQSLTFCFAKMLHAKMLRAHSSTSDLCVWRLLMNPPREVSPFHCPWLFPSQLWQQTLLKLDVFETCQELSRTRRRAGDAGESSWTNSRLSRRRDDMAARTARLD